METCSKKQLGHTIKQQHAIDSIRVDFACLEKMTVIEIIGKIHDYQKEDDKNRTTILEENGFTVIRFTNEEVFANRKKVTTDIKSYLDNKEVVSQVLPTGEDFRWDKSIYYPPRHPFWCNIYGAGTRTRNG